MFKSNCAKLNIVEEQKECWPVYLYHYLTLNNVYTKLQIKAKHLVSRYFRVRAATRKLINENMINIRVPLKYYGCTRDFFAQKHLFVVKAHNLENP